MRRRLGDACIWLADYFYELADRLDPPETVTIPIILPKPREYDWRAPHDPS